MCQLSLFCVKIACYVVNISVLICFILRIDDNISNQPGKKRKHDDVSEMNNESDNDAEVSTPQKKVCTSSSSA